MKKKVKYMNSLFIVVANSSSKANINCIILLKLFECVGRITPVNWSFTRKVYRHTYTYTHTQTHVRRHEVWKRTVIFTIHQVSSFLCRISVFKTNKRMERNACDGENKTEKNTMRIKWYKWNEYFYCIDREETQREEERYLGCKNIL